MTARVRSPGCSLAAALVALTGSACIDENILDQMADNQPKANRYRESKFYADGLTMQAPPEGTVPRERITLNAVADDRPRGATDRSRRTASRCPCTRRRCRSR